VLAALAARLPRDAILVEETPSSRPDLHALVPAREPMGFVSAAMGGLGFGLPAALGIRMGRPDRPVVAVVGDGSSMYGIQALWSAAHYRIGVLFVVLANGRYAIMDRLAERTPEAKAPWPAFDEISVAGLALAMGCAAMTVADLARLEQVFDQVLPDLANRQEPLLLEVTVEPDPTFNP
jgi:benzoylformate decarboxylase